MAECYSATGVNQSDFPRCLNLIPGKAWLAWRILEQNGNSQGMIEFSMARTEGGWMSIGIGEEQSGGMGGADIIVVQNVSGQVTAGDYFAEGFMAPAKDEIQDVKLHSHSIADGFSQARVSRPLSTCNTGDRSIRKSYPHRLLFALGADNDWTMKYHGPDARGSIVVNFYEEDLYAFQGGAPQAGPDAQGFITQYNAYHIPTAQRPLGEGIWQEGTNQYKCFAVPLEHVANLTPPFDIIEAHPIVGSQYLHHFVNSVCRNDPRPNTTIPYGEHPANDIYDCAMGGSEAAGCSGLPGWAVGGVSSKFPSDVGVRIREGSKWILLNTHFYNPTLDSDAVDNSGFKWIGSKKLRPKQLGTLWTGMSLTMRLEPGLKRAHFTQHCPAQAVAHLFADGQDTLEILEVVHHLHQRGRIARTYVVREGKRIPLVIQDFYDYNFQAGNPVKFFLKRGDAIEVHCAYDTQQATDDIRWGERTQDEMCISILQVTPVPEGRSKLMCASHQMTTSISNYTMGFIRWDTDTDQAALMQGAACHVPPAACPPDTWNRFCHKAGMCFLHEVCNGAFCGSPMDIPQLKDKCKMAKSMCEVCYSPGNGECTECTKHCEPMLNAGLMFNLTELHQTFMPLQRSDETYDLPWGESWAEDYNCDLDGAEQATSQKAISTTSPANHQDTDKATDGGSISGAVGQMQWPMLVVAIPLITTILHCL
eukprot:gnl/MRDRNA2_/MRDRNA2_29761_c0_seq1.p1 gnl/MRDRNA2_/MRDRNA2_29761_c0~~gnl/MRDRNA2_/MRDRNA2_29761_c0_seq1.p1  ORF type:complete len:754 (-),score=111.00 gnl/MRDRNA2_/MRDRNA2_29761_c0_seq1:79-2190(-)